MASLALVGQQLTKHLEIVLRGYDSNMTQHVNRHFGTPPGIVVLKPFSVPSEILLQWYHSIPHMATSIESDAPTCGPSRVGANCEICISVNIQTSWCVSERPEVHKSFMSSQIPSQPFSLFVIILARYAKVTTEILPA